MIIPNAINDIEARLCELESCFDIIGQINDLISNQIKLPRGGKDYPQQLLIMIELGKSKIEAIRKENEEMFNALK